MMPHPCMVRLIVAVACSVLLSGKSADAQVGAEGHGGNVIAIPSPDAGGRPQEESGSQKE
jgi:hypothetical protein